MQVFCIRKQIASRGAREEKKQRSNIQSQFLIKTNHYTNIEEERAKHLKAG
jgi:hypothetical protein